VGNEGGVSAIGGNAIGAEGGVSAMAAVVLGPIPGKAFAEVSGTAAVVPGNATHCAFGMVFVVCSAGGATAAESAIGNAVGATGGVSGMAAGGVATGIRATPGKAFAEASGMAAVVPGTTTLQFAFGMVFVVCAAGGAGTAAGSAVGNAVGAAGGVSGTAAVVPGNALHVAAGMVFVVCAAGGAATAAGSAIGNAAGSAIGNAVGAAGGVSGMAAGGVATGIGATPGKAFAEVSGAGAGMTCVCTVSAKRR